MIDATVDDLPEKAYVVTLDRLRAGKGIMVISNLKWACTEKSSLVKRYFIEATAGKKKNKYSREYIYLTHEEAYAALLKLYDSEMKFCIQKFETLKSKMKKSIKDSAI